MKLKTVRFKTNIRLPNGTLSSHATVVNPRQRISYIEMVGNFIVIHKDHLSTIVPLSNVAHCETMEEPAINLLTNTAPEGHSHVEEAEQGKGTNPAKTKKARKKASVL